MAEKPSYEELEQRIRDLELEKLHGPMLKSTVIPGGTWPTQTLNWKMNRNSIFSEFNLETIIDAKELQAIMDDFCGITNMVTAILDLKGRVIESTGWLDICTKFHRVNPVTSKNCTESDLFLAKNLKAGEYVSYKCKNGLWDVVTPLYIGDMHLGNIFTGQFFYDDELVDEQVFVRQAETYGFDKDAYLAAFRRIPRYSRKTIDLLMGFLTKFTAYISRMGLTNIHLEREVAEREIIEGALRDNERLLNEMGRISKIGGWEFDTESLKGTWTEEVSRIHEMDPGDPTNVESGISFYHGENRITIETAVKEAIELGKPYDLELEMVTREGRHKWVRTIGYPVKEGDAIVKVRGSIQDITDRKKAEQEIRSLNRDLELRVHQRTAQLEEANKELEDFVYSVSHDLRAPLRSISGFAQIIDRRHKASLNEEGQHYFDNIIKASGQMGDFIDDLLSFSRLGRKAIKHETVSLADVFKAAMDMLSDSITKTGAVINLPDTFPDSVGDKILMTHIVVNLLENALKYHKANTPPRIRVSIKENKDTVTISVEDNGIGIAPEYHEKIFNIFQRLHNQEDYPGTGIGLSAVKKAVQMMGGTVGVESEPGKGSIFKINILKGDGPVI